MSSIFRDKIYEKDRLSNKEIMKLEDTRADVKVKCKCGHVMIVPPRKDKVVCTWCGKYVFKSKEDEFKFRLLNKLSQ